MRISTSLPLALTAALVLALVPVAAHADDEDADEFGKSVEMDEQDTSSGQTGGEENPNDPTLRTESEDDDKGDSDAAAEKESEPEEDLGDYPTEFVIRPIVLHSGMSQVGIDFLMNASPFFLDGVLSAKYGISNDAELGLRYGLGALNEDEFLEGKVITLDVTYQIINGIGAQVAVPFYLDPFAMGLYLGAPVAFFINNKIRIFGGHDMVGFKFKRFLPNPNSTAANEALVETDAVNGIVPDGEFNINAAIAYQFTTNIAAWFEFRQSWPDFSSDNDATSFYLNALYSLGGTFDIGVKLGIGKADEAEDSFGIGLLARLRI